MVLFSITIFIRQEMEFMGIHDMPEYHLIGIKQLFLGRGFRSVIFLGGKGVRKKDQDQAKSRYQYRFDAVRCHIYLLICRKDKAGGGKSEIRA